MNQNGDQFAHFSQMMMPSEADPFGMWMMPPMGPFDLNMPEMPGMPQLNPWADGFNPGVLDGFDPTSWGPFPGPLPDMSGGLALTGLQGPEANGHLQLPPTESAAADAPLELDALAHAVAEGIGLDDIDSPSHGPSSLPNGTSMLSLESSLPPAGAAEHEPLQRSSADARQPEVQDHFGDAAEDDDDEAHWLAHAWGLWVLMAPPRRGRRPLTNWTDGQRLVHGFSTAEGFWRMIRHVHSPSNLQEGVDFSVFREGITPDWEDPHCAGGGRWLAQLKNVHAEGLDFAWLSVCLACIGGNCDHTGEAVLGCVVSVRHGQSKIAIWLNVPLKHKSRLLGIGNSFRSALGDVAPDEVLYEDFKDGKAVLALSASEHREVFDEPPTLVPRKGGERGSERGDQSARGERYDYGHRDYRYDNRDRDYRYGDRDGTNYQKGKGKGKSKWYQYN